MSQSKTFNISITILYNVWFSFSEQTKKAHDVQFALRDSDKRFLKILSDWYQTSFGIEYAFKYVLENTHAP